MTSDSEATAATLKEAVIYYPLSFCQNHVEIIDTPGLSDDAEMTEVTSSVINQCDLAIMIISAQTPFSTSEADFLTNCLLSNGIKHILFIVNRVDLLNDFEDIKKSLISLVIVFKSVFRSG